MRAVSLGVALPALQRECCSVNDTSRVCISACSGIRRRFALEWLKTHRHSKQPLVIVASRYAVTTDLVHHALADDETPAFRIHRYTVDQLAEDFAHDALIDRGLIVANPIVRRALVGRTVALLKDSLNYYAPVIHTSGFSRVVAEAIDELRLHAVSLDDLKAFERIGPELAALSAQFGKLLEEENFIDRAELYKIATASINDRHRIAQSHILLYDLELSAPCEVAFLSALNQINRTVSTTIPSADVRARDRLFDVVQLDQIPLERAASDSSALSRLKNQIFAHAADPGQWDPSVSLMSSATPYQEVVEVFRRATEMIASGTLPEQIAIVMREPAPYVELIEEVAARVEVTCFLAEGAYRPDPSGRAFLLLLRCAIDQLAATTFAEYLSLGQLPRRGSGDQSDAEQPAPPPARWERLIGDAAVVGGIERWKRRLAGLRMELLTQLSDIDDRQSPRARAMERDGDALDELYRFAIPLLEKLSELPRQATWAIWIDNLWTIAELGLREPQRIHEILEQLRPLGDVGPFPLDHIVEALTFRLKDLRRAPDKDRHGKIYVGLAHELRGMAFEHVFVVGLAERSFPKKVLQHPILLNSLRQWLKKSAKTLPSASDRRHHERLGLQLAVGAATSSISLSYPRTELSRGHARVPSFYLLEAARAITGTLPTVHDIVARAAENRPSHRADDALDNTEYDLAIFGEAYSARSEQPNVDLGGFASHIDQHPHLLRALRAHWAREGKAVTSADGLVAAQQPPAALSDLGLSSVAYAPTALERFGRCPYQFFLGAVLRLRPKRGLEPDGHQQIDPLTRGSVIHGVQARLYQELQRRSLLPVTVAGSSAAQQLLSETFEQMRTELAEEVAPAVPVLWHQEMDRIAAELKGWLHREAEQGSAYVPTAFEFAFGLDGQDVALVDGRWKLKGRIDLVERSPDGSVRITDYKTGRVPDVPPPQIGGGTSLQRVLYGLAWEALHPNDRAVEGRLYFATQRGGYREVSTPLSPAVRQAARLALETVDNALRNGYLPAVPAQDMCQMCDYAVICGRRAADRGKAMLRHHDARLQPLRRLRKLP